MKNICPHCQKELSNMTIKKHQKEEVQIIIEKLMGIHWTVIEKNNPEKIMMNEFNKIKERLLDFRSGAEMARMCNCSQSRIASWLENCDSEENEEKSWKKLGEYHGHAYYDFSYPAVLLFLEKNYEKIEEEKRNKNKWNYQERKSLKESFIECSFFCEKCGKEIEAMSDSQAVRGYNEGSLSLRKTKEILKQAHIRHEHTEYDNIISEKCDKIANMKNINYENRQELFQEAKKESRHEIYN